MRDRRDADRRAPFRNQPERRQGGRVRLAGSGRTLDRETSTLQGEDQPYRSAREKPNTGS